MGDLVSRDIGERFLSAHATASILYDGYVLPKNIDETQSKARVWQFWNKRQEEKDEIII